MSKASKRRRCPAVGREISPAECGENRGSRYACPAECPFNPFAPANYSDYLDLEKRVDGKTLTWLKANPTNAERLEQDVQRAMAGKSVHRLSNALTWHAHFYRNAAGRTPVERWQSAGFPDLNNDERVVMGGKLRIRIALIEIHRVLDDHRTEVVDLLASEPEPFVVVDRSLAAVAVRFQPYVCWAYPLPLYWRLFGAALVLPSMGPIAPVEIVTELVRHLGGPGAGPNLQTWLAEHFHRLEEALCATAQARREQFFSSVDAKFGKVIYALVAPIKECCGLLDEDPAVEPDSLRPAEKVEGYLAARVWFDDGPNPPAAQATGRVVLGRVLLGYSQWRLEAMGATRLALFRERFEQRLGQAVRFVSEHVQDLTAQLTQDEPPFDRSLVPPRLLEESERLVLYSSRVPMTGKTQSPEALTEASRAAYERSFPDDKIPALDDHTPREAARDPALRPKLIQLLKTRIRLQDEENLRTGGTEDSNGLLRELGMEEILFDPPPYRPDQRHGQGLKW